MKIHLNFLLSPVRATEIMQAADIFEPFKVLIVPLMTLEIELEEGADPLAILEKLKETYADDAEDRLIAIWNSEDSRGAWHDETVKAVSTGHKWSTLDKVLRQFGCPLAVTALDGVR